MHMRFSKSLLILTVLLLQLAVFNSAGSVVGDLDPSFNFTGQLTTDFIMWDDVAKAVAVQSDGRIVVVGSAYNGNDNDFAVARYNPDGTLDTTFGTMGKVITAFSASGDDATGVALQSDGKIVVAGIANNAPAFDFAVVRYNANGTLDTSFGVVGKVVTPLGVNFATVSGVVVQSDGKIVVVGNADNGVDDDFALVRYNANGTLDTTFNGTGKILMGFGYGSDGINSVALQTDGKIVVAGYATNNAFGVDCVVARFDTTGTLDPTFNVTGVVMTSLTTNDEGFSAVAVQGDGKIVAAGYANNGSNYDFAVVRYTSLGVLDTNFNLTGMVITPVGTGDDIISGMALQNDGKIVVAGRSFDGTGVSCAVVRYASNGSLDATFKGTGKTTVNLGPGDDSVGGVALQGDGKIVVAGWVGAVPDFAVARLLGDGPAIAVEMGAGAGVFDGISTVQFPGASTSVTFTIHNTGIASLTGLGITIDGAGSSSFSITTSPIAPVAPSGSTTFTVFFQPVSAGLKTAALHIASNVTGNTQSYDIGLAGGVANPLEVWRQTWYGTTANSGNAADTADPYHTGVPNLLVFGLFGPSQNPSQVAARLLPKPQRVGGGSYTVTFTQPEGVSGVSYGAEWCANLVSGVWQTITDTGTGTGHIFSVPIGINTRMFMRLRVISF